MNKKAEIIAPKTDVIPFLGPLVARTVEIVAPPSIYLPPLCINHETFRVELRGQRDTTLEGQWWLSSVAARPTTRTLVGNTYKERTYPGGSSNALHEQKMRAVETDRSIQSGLSLLLFVASKQATTFAIAEAYGAAGRLWINWADAGRLSEGRKVIVEHANFAYATKETKKGTYLSAWKVKGWAPENLTNAEKQMIAAIAEQSRKQIEQYFEQ